MSEPLPAIRSTRYQSLDFWRGVACLMVAVYHAAFYIVDQMPAHAGQMEKLARMCLDRMWYGVPMFFVISGYCITASCISTRDKGRSAREYFIRRLRRIFPPYWVVLGSLILAVLIAGAMGANWIFYEDVAPVPQLHELSPLRWFTNITLTEGMRYSLMGHHGHLIDSFFLSPAWTLAYEEQFYIVCGLALVAMPRRIMTALLAITIGVAALFAIHEFLVPLPLQGFFCDGRWLIFAAGILTYYRINVIRPELRWRVDLTLLALLAISFLIVRQHHSHLAIELRVGLAFALVICLLHRHDRAISQSRWLSPISWCGVMCYSIYLVHYPIEKVIAHLMYRHGFTGVWETLAITVPLAVLPSIAVAALFYHFIERHFLNSIPVRAGAEPHRKPDATATVEPNLIQPEAAAT